MSDPHAPPSPGRLNLELNLRPVSLQSSSKQRRELKSAVLRAVGKTDYLLSGEVEVAIVWLLHERERYIGVHSPDIDNILKPLLDAISGPEGVLINDCQVQSVRCHWIDRVSDDQQIQIEIRFSPDEWVRKKDLVWVEVANKLCMPFSTGVPAPLQAAILQSWETSFALRAKIIAATNDYGAGQYCMPMQMPFHRSRLRAFTVVPLTTMKAHVDALAERN